jgi:hypothetical protein
MRAGRSARHDAEILTEEDRLQAGRADIRAEQIRHRTLGAAPAGEDGVEHRGAARAVSN